MKHCISLVVLAVAGLVVSIAGVALAGTSSLYLNGDAVPVATMSSGAPSSAILPNFDPGRDQAAGLLLRRGGKGPQEKDPTRFQLWHLPVAEMSFEVTGFTIWAADAGMDGSEEVEFEAYLMLCNPECEVVDQLTKSISHTSEWRKVTLALRSAEYTYGSDDRLVVKIIVTSASQDDMWFAYGTRSYPAHLSLIETSTTTTPPDSSTSTAFAPSTTTTVGTSTTTLPADATSTTSAVLLSGGPGEPPDNPGNVDKPATPEETGFFGMDPDDHVIQLSPQKGLSAAYATVTENVGIYWQVAVALGALMAVLLIAGFDEEESESDPGRRIFWHRRLNRI